MRLKHLAQVDRRLLRHEMIPAAGKVYSLIERHTQWIQKGKARPNAKLGHRFLVATDQHDLVQDYIVLIGGPEVEQSPPSPTGCSTATVPVVSPVSASTKA